MNSHITFEGLNYMDEGLFNKYDKSLMEITRKPEIDTGNLKKSFSVITESASNTLNIDRSSVWIFNHEKQILHCENLYEKRKNMHSNGVQFQNSEYPMYTKAILNSSIICAQEVTSEPKLAELVNEYLLPLNVRSALELPIYYNGNVIGLLSLQETGQKHIWNENEKAYVHALSNIVSRAYAAFERCNIQRELATANVELEHTVEQKTHELAKMVRVLCHDIANPLMVISVFSEAYNGGGISADIPKAWDKVFTNAQKIEKLISRARSYVKNNSRGSAQTAASISNLNKTLKDSLDTLEVQFKRKNLNISVKLPDPKFCEIHADNLTLENEILNNVLTNAIKFSEPGGIVEITADETPFEIKLSIQDYGIGIPADMLKTFHEKKSIENRIGTANETGTGFGLGMVVAQMTTYQGEVQIESSTVTTPYHPKGTKVTLIFIKAQKNDKSAVV